MNWTQRHKDALNRMWYEDYPGRGPDMEDAPKEPRYKVINGPNGTAKVTLPARSMIVVNGVKVLTDGEVVVRTRQDVVNKIKNTNKQEPTDVG